MEGEDFEKRSAEGKRVSAHLEDLKYKQLQKLAKTLKLPSQMKKQFLLEVIQAKNAGNTAEVEEIIIRSKMEKMGGKPVKEKDKNKSKRMASEIISSEENKMFTIKPRPNKISQNFNSSHMIVRYNDNTHNIIRTRAKTDSLLSSTSDYNQSDVIDSTMDMNNNDYLVTTKNYQNHTTKETSQTRDSNYNIFKDDVPSEKPTKRVLKSLLLAPDSTSSEYNDSGISGMQSMLQPCDQPFSSFDNKINYATQQTPLIRKTLPQTASLLRSKSDFIGHRPNLLKGTIKYIIPAGKKCVQTIRYIQKIPNPTEHSHKITVPEKKVYENSDYSVANFQDWKDNNVLDYDGIDTNVTNPLYPCQEIPNPSLEPERDDSDYFIQEIGNSHLLNSSNIPFTADSGITSDVLIDSIENNDMNLMADNFLLKDLVKVASVNTENEDSKMDSKSCGMHNVADDLSDLLPYMAGFDKFTDTDQMVNQLVQTDVKTVAERDGDGENVCCLDSLFSINSELLFQPNNEKAADPTIGHTDVPDDTCSDNITTNDVGIVLYDDNNPEVLPTTNVNTEAFLQKVPKIMSPNFVDKNKEISFPLILEYLQNTESNLISKELKPSPVSPSEDTSDLSVSTTDLDDDTLSLICQSDLMSDEPDSDASDCFYCTWRGNLFSIDDHIRQYHKNYIHTASDTGSIDHTVSLATIQAHPNQCLPVVILAYGRLIFLRVNYHGKFITAHLSSIPSHSTDHQKMNGTIEIFSKDEYQSFLWTGAIQTMDNNCSYFNFNPTENCLKVQLLDIGYSEEENGNSILENLGNNTQFKYRIKVDCIY